MDAIAQPLSRVQVAATAFAYDARVRLVAVQTEEALRPAVLAKFADAESLMTPATLTFVLESPFEPDDANWLLRAEELLEEWQSASDELVAAKLEALPAISAKPAATAADFAAFVQTLAASVTSRFRLALVIAPLVVAPAVAGQMIADMAAFVNAPHLAPVRWVIVTNESLGLGSLVASLKQNGGTYAADFVEARVDPAGARAGLSAMVAGMKAAPVGASPLQLAGFAGPSVAPPPRIREAPQQTPEAQRSQMAAQGVPAGYGDVSAMHGLRIAIMEAALAAGEGRFADAVGAQKRACDITQALGLHQETGQMELLLGTYTLTGGQAKRALEIFAATAASAEAAKLGTLACQAKMAQGSALAMLAADPGLSPEAAHNKRMDAAAAYVEAGNVGAALGAWAVAIEAYRLGGDMLAALSDVPRAIAAWEKAVSVAETAPPADVAGSSALDVAKLVEKRFHAAGRPSDAQAWKARAQALALRFEQASPAEVAV